MWPIFHRLLSLVVPEAGPKPGSDSPVIIDSSAASGPTVDRGNIVEGSTEPTYLVPTDALRVQVTRFAGLGVVIRYGEFDRENLVADLRRGFLGGEFPRLTQVTQFLAAQTIEELGALKDGALQEKTFGVGQVDPMLLDRARDMRRLVQLLTLGYPHFADLVPEFDSTSIVGASLDGRVIDQAALDELRAPRTSSIGGESDQRSRIDLMRIVIGTFEALGEPVSLNQLKFLNPYVPGLANCAEDRRTEIVRRILMDQFPFNLENRDNWHSEIGSAM